MLLRAFAKINLDLRVGERRPDGYHEIRTILQTIDWFDEIHIERSSRFQFTVADGAGSESNFVENNLVVRAVRAFEAAARDNFSATDEASLVERLEQVEISVVLGSERNIKITRPSDMDLARLFFEQETARR